MTVGSVKPFQTCEQVSLSKPRGSDYGCVMRRRILFLMGGFIFVAATAEIVVRPVRPDRPDPIPRKVIVIPDPKDAAPDPANPSSLDTLEMRNGDRLRGRIESMDSKEGVRLIYEGSIEPLRIKPPAVNRIQFAESKQAPVVEGVQFRVILANGDEITGSLLELTAEAVVIESGLAGRLTIPRSSLVQLARASSQQTIYEGPNHAKEWNSTRIDGDEEMGIVEDVPLPFFGRGNILPAIVNGLAAVIRPTTVTGWAFRNNGWVSQQPGTVLYRSFKLPQRYELEVDVAWRGELQFGIIFNALKPQLGNGDAHQLLINPDSIDLERFTANGEANGLGSVNLAELRKKNRARFTLRVDCERGVVGLIVDGQFVREWRDANKMPAGSIIGFKSDSGAGFRLERIQIENWDGQTLLKAPNAVPGKGESVRLLNGDSIAGMVKAGQAGKLQIESSFGAVEVGFEKIRHIEFSPVARADQPAAELLRGTFQKRQKATFKIEKWSPNEIAIISPVWGRATIQRDALRSLEFNLDKPLANRDAFDY